MDAYALLQQDHETVKSILAELEAERAAKRREGLFAELNLELTVHAMAEEKFLYPLLENAEETRDSARAAVAEHEVLKRLLEELDSGDMGSDAWRARLKAFRERVERHLETEAAGLHLQARGLIGEAEAERLGAAMEAFREDQILTLEI